MVTHGRSVAAVAIAGWLSVLGAGACSSAPDASQGDAADSAPGADSSAIDAGFDVGADVSVDAGLDASVEAPGPGAPSLVALAVSASPEDGAASSGVLSPAFSANVHDYTVRCAAGINVLTVSMTASNGSTSLLVQPTPSPSLPQQTLSVSVAENQAVVAAATNGAATV